jgi:hypothetical protein
MTDILPQAPLAQASTAQRSISPGKPDEQYGGTGRR